MSEISGMSGFMRDSMTSISEKAEIFLARAKEMTSQEGGITHENLLELQFEMSQYTTMVESISNITKGITDTLKSLAQKV